VSAFVTAGAGFLLAVLWFDLMFDVQVAAHRCSEQLPDEVLASIAGYYRRVTTAARPMNRLIALVMIATLAAIVVEIAAGEMEAWVAWASIALALPPIVLAGAHTVPAAKRLGTRRDPVALQSAAARSIFLDHLLCACSIAALLALQLAFA
jgi:hypothetical protein